MRKYKSIFSFQISPMQQAVSIVVVTIIVLAIVKLLITYGGIRNNPTVYWEASFAMLMIYMLFTSIWSITNKNKTTYFMYSVLGFVGVAVVTGLLARWFSGYTMDQAGSFRWLYVIFTVSYMIFMGIVGAMRKILEIVKKQDARLRGEDIEE